MPAPLQFGKPMLPFSLRQVVSEPGASSVSQIVRTPQPKRGGPFVVSGEHLAAIGTESCGAEAANIGKLREASAGDGIPHDEATASNGGEGWDGAERIPSPTDLLSAGLWLTKIFETTRLY